MIDPLAILQDNICKMEKRKLLDSTKKMEIN
jgi:hypothetical protein